MCKFAYRAKNSCDIGESALLSFFNFAEGGGPLSMSQGGVRFGVGGRHLGPVCFGLGREE